MYTYYTTGPRELPVAFLGPGKLSDSLGAAKGTPLLHMIENHLKSGVKNLKMKFVGVLSS